MPSERHDPPDSAPAGTTAPGHRRMPRAPLGGFVERDLTTGSLGRHILALGVPGALINLLQFSYHFIDMIWLGQIGPQAIAVATTYHFFFMVFVFFNQIIGIGSITFISRTFGAKDFEGCRRVIGQTFSFKVVIAIIVMVLGLVLQRWMWTAFGSSDEVIELGVQYTTVMFSVIPIYFSAFTMRTAFTAIGDVKTLLKISAVSTGINLLLDPLLIFETVKIGPFPFFGITEPLISFAGAGWGVRGAAWASFGAIFVLFAMGLFYFISGRTFLRVGVRYFYSWSWRTVLRVMRVGVPPAIGENLHSFAMIVIGRIINEYGTAAFAAAGIVHTCFGLVFIPVGGISQAVSTLVGQNLGAGKPERAERSVWQAAGYTLAILMVILTLVALWPEALARLFVPHANELARETLAYAVEFLRIAALIMFAMGAGMVFSSAFWGSGDTKAPMWTMVGTTYGIQLPVVLSGWLWFGWQDPVFIIRTWLAAGIVNTIALILIFLRGRWKYIKV